MQQSQFEATGTVWTIVIDTESIPQSFWESLEHETRAFEARQSRFIASSEVMQLAQKPAGTYPISYELSTLLHFAQTLKQETQGLFDPAVGELLELSGYDSKYSFKPAKNISQWVPVQWSVYKQQVTISKHCVFDIGGFGKGYWIDQLSKMIETAGYKSYLVDGGGDMYGSSKKSKEPWNIAIETPGKSGEAASTVQLEHQGLAVSDIFKRQWKEWNHVINPKEKAATKSFVGSAVLASTAQLADGLSTCMMLADTQVREMMAKKHHAEYLLFISSEKLIHSKAWPGKLYNATG